MGKLTVINNPAGYMVPEALGFRNSLREDEQAIFDELYLTAYPNIKLMEQATELVIPLERVLFAMLIVQQKEIERIIAMAKS